MLLLGEFETGPNLGTHYTRRGFTVLPPGQTIDVGTLLAGVPIRTRPTSSRRLRTHQPWAH